MRLLNLRINFFFLKKKQHQNYQDEDKKSATNKKKINSQIKKPHLKMIPIKDNW